MNGKIVIDAMGGDYAPTEVVKGAADAARLMDVNLVLTGREDAILNELKKYEYPKEKIEILNASEVITPDEAPTVALKQKKDSSMVVGLKYVKEGKAKAFVSAGSTGALMAGATLIVGRIRGIERPALATLLPGANGFSLMLDSGANVDAKPQYLLQYAQMGSVYMESVLGKANPRVALINIGAEKEKGNALSKEAYVLLENSGLNFVGNIEARDIPFNTEAEIIICDAFVGNIILKYTEGFAKAMLGMVKKHLMSSALSKIGAFLAKGAFAGLKKSFDYSEVGGAPLLGLNALVVKAHGSSDAKAVTSAIRQCKSFIDNDITEKIREKIF
ncbi:MAG: phosphate acyltransferase PlsX [Clostridiales bacterium]|nr:phosphate acyltransferase PlsX [Clostridiales bacterium]